MDKRTILFMICISLAFFGIQWWFAPDKQGTEKRIAEQKNVQKQAREKEVAFRTAKVEDLPIAEFYSTPNGGETLGSAIECGGHYFTLAWEESLPSKVYIKKDGSFKALNL